MNINELEGVKNPLYNILYSVSFKDAQELQEKPIKEKVIPKARKQILEVLAITGIDQDRIIRYCTKTNTYKDLNLFDEFYKYPLKHKFKEAYRDNQLLYFCLYLVQQRYGLAGLAEIEERIVPENKKRGKEQVA